MDDQSSSFDESSSSSDDSFLLELVNDIIMDDCSLFIAQHAKPKIVMKPKQAITKSNYWYEVFPVLTDSAFKGRYRRSRESFMALASELYKPEYYPSEDQWLKTFAITVDYLCTGCRIQDLVILYDVSQGKAHQDINACLDFIIGNWLPVVRTWPTETERGQLAALNWKRYKMPMCVGAIDGTLVKIKGFQPNRQELNSRKNHFAFNVLLICDFYGSIRYYVCDAPGSMADVSVYEETQLYNNINEYLCNSNRPTHPYYLISDKGIPNSDYIVTPFPDNGKLTTQQLKFNHYLQSARSIIERVNGILKQRYQILNGTMVAVHELKAKQIIKACIALYNDEIKRGDLVLYSQETVLDDGSVLEMMHEYYQSPFIDEFSGSREFLYEFIMRQI